MSDLSNATLVLIGLVLVVVVIVMALRVLATWIGGQFNAQAMEQARAQALIQRRLDDIEAAARQDADNWQRIERELLKFKAEMPTNYVRREDFVQSMASIMTRLDAMALRFENVLLKQGK